MPRPSRAKPTINEESSALSSAASVASEPITTQSAANETTGTKRKRQLKQPVYHELDEDEDEDEPEEKPAPAKRGRQSKAVKVDQSISPPQKKATKSTKPVEDIEEPETKPKVVKKRKTKEEKEAEAMPLAARTIGHKLFIGAHVSAAGGVPNAVQNAVHIGANAFALFLKSQRKWANPPLDETHSINFHAHCDKHDFDQNSHVVPHGSYLVNLAHTDPERTKQAYDSFLDDLKRCEKLGISLYNFHPGNSVGGDRDAAIAHLAGNLNRAHKETSKVITLLENMAAGGNVIGSTFEDLRDVINLIDDKSRVGVCLDTCHAFAGGYDLRTPETVESTLSDFDKTVGMKYLRALHLNDSKAPFSSHRDLHANIGTGFLGLRGFHAIMNDERVIGLPMVLETPIEVRDENGNLQKDAKNKDMEDKNIWAREIKLLESLVGMDVDGEEFKELEDKLQKMGKVERDRIAEQVEKKTTKVKDKEDKAKAKQTKLNFGKAAPAKKGKKSKKDDDAEQSDASSLSAPPSDNES
ncbi:AP endonuclease [Aureobasidium sp. EXF-3400]|nr:AP endonuclease [Aureobasidium sp. EXF-12344]KAI4772724.1 AP endonuclease [Aureobasidium sp. EXF-3400]